MADGRSTRSSQSPSRYSSGDDVEVDERILFGMNKLVNKIKTRETQSVKSSRSRDSLKSKKSERSKHSKRSAVTPQFQQKYDTTDILSLGKKSSQSRRSRNSKKSNSDFHQKDPETRSSRSKKWSKSSGQPREEEPRRMPEVNADSLFDFFGTGKPIDMDKVSSQPSFLNRSQSRMSSRKSKQMDEDLRHLDQFIEPTIKPKTKEQELDEKIELLAEWDELAKKSRDRNLKRFTIDSDLDEIRLEIKKVKAQKKRENALKFMGLMTYTAAKGVEMMFDKIEFVNVDLNGWSGALKHNMSDFDEVFAELYDKYRGSGKGLPPEVRFLFLFLTSAVQFVIMNKAPQAIADFLNAGSSKFQQPQNMKRGPPPPQQSRTGGYREMSGPDIEGDPELEELLFDLEKRKGERMG